MCDAFMGKSPQYIGVLKIYQSAYDVPSAMHYVNPRFMQICGLYKNSDYIRMRIM